MWIDLENIRNCAITSDEWVELCNIMAQVEEFNDYDRERMPDLVEWANEVKKTKGAQWQDRTY